MSPWVDLEEGAEKIGKEFVFSWKPNPAIFLENNWDIDSVKNQFRRNLNKIKNCNVQIGKNSIIFENTGNSKNTNNRPFAK